MDNSKINYYDSIIQSSMPKHIAVIMDGNGRWAKSKNKKRVEGHRIGANNLEKISNEVRRLKIPYLTAYAFSTENWSRPKEEVTFLMNLLRKFLVKNKKDAIKSDTRIKIIGDVSKLDNDLQDKIKDIEEITKDHKSLDLQIAINYGSRDEILRAIKKIGTDISDGRIEIDMINDNLFESYLDTANIPNPDLLIRTSGEQRISNFLLWQIAYSEMYFSDRYWPDFDREELYKAIYYYQKRDRRFGSV